MNLKELISHTALKFRITGDPLDAFPVTAGHINDSWRILTTAGEQESYILQKINSNVFKNIPELMQNILRVTKHLEKKILSADPDASHFSVLRLIPSTDGEPAIKDKEGNWWRMFNFINGTRSYDTVVSPELAEAAGNAFGRFQYLAADIPSEELIVTIPDFHNMGFRLRNFRNSVSCDAASRVHEVQQEIRFAEERAYSMMAMQGLVDTGQLPLRVTHNDTKCNNVLFNEDNKAVCIVDLDTVMPGTVLHDFGDAIRTGANTGAEDEKDLQKVGLNIDLFAAYARGYLSIANRFLTPVEKENLAFSARFMTYIIGLRFLTDHLDGDRYYRIAFPGHNLQRARAQFRLLESMEERFGEMQKIIKKYSE
jgi:Ser/Thr protein kinase RdoA (MazF antagonist)